MSMQLVEVEVGLSEAPKNYFEVEALNITRLSKYSCETQSSKRSHRLSKAGNRHVGDPYSCCYKSQ